MRSRQDLRSYQTRTVDFILDKKKCALWIDMGLGKTVSTLTAIVDLLYDFAISRVLVIAPKKVAEATWRDEVTQWAHTRDLSVAVAVGTPKQRREALDSDADIVCINVENVQWLEQEYAPVKKWKWDMIVLDESSCFKAPDSKRFRSLRRILKRNKKTIGYLVELTGTPASNGYLNIWAQIYLLDFGQRLQTSYTSYKSIYFMPDYNGFGHTIMKGAEKQIQKRIADKVLVLREQDYLTLPDRFIVPVMVRLSKQQLDRYYELQKDYLLNMDEQEIYAVNAGVLYGKLCQFATGDCYDEDRQVINIHDEKIEALARIVEENTGSPILLAYNYQHERDKIKKAFPKIARELKTDQDIKDWNARKIPLAYAHPRSIGHGLNLQFGGHIIVWYSMTSDLELYLQLNKRLHRSGQQQPVMVYVLLTQNTIEELVVLPKIENKDADQRDLMDAVMVYALDQRKSN